MSAHVTTPQPVVTLDERADLEVAFDIDRPSSYDLPFNEGAVLTIAVGGDQIEVRVKRISRAYTHGVTATHRVQCEFRGVIR